MTATATRPSLAAFVKEAYPNNGKKQTGFARFLGQLVSDTERAEVMECLATLSARQLHAALSTAWPEDVISAGLTVDMVRNAKMLFNAGTLV
jgi:hypothetical protein